MRQMNRQGAKALAAVFLGLGVLLAFLLPEGIVVVLLAATLILLGILCFRC